MVLHRNEPITSAAANGKGMTSSYSAVIAMIVMAELDWIMLVATKPMRIYHPRHRWLNLVISIASFKATTPSFIISSQKNTSQSDNTIRKKFLYFLLNNVPSHPIAIIGKT